MALSPFKVALEAPTHTPKVDARWNYSVHAFDQAGRPLRARLTVQIVDPFGGVHPVEFGSSHREVANVGFTGRFRDFVTWPAESRGFRLIFRVTVTSKGKAIRVNYWVRPR